MTHKAEQLKTISAKKLRGNLEKVSQKKASVLEINRCGGLD